MLVLTREIGETFSIGDDITVQILGINGNQVRLGINAPKDIKVHRAGWLGPAVRQALVLPARSGKSVSVQDRKLIHCHFPVVCRMTPVGGDVAQPKPYQFRRSLIGREVPSSLDDLA
ncbi:hypothetical protein PsgB076_07072 [Pseudomonas savastanoi pv. glycinea str. B076]|nr:hypothetical protein PsgB076_07072 [Pseudomonas savastanoi pv. glycinea str. B076]